MTRFMLGSVLGAFVLAPVLFAQTPVEKPADPPKAAAKPEPPKAPPVLSDAEKAAIDVLSLIAQRDAALKDLGACTAQLAPLTAQVRETQLRARIDSLRQVIEKSHPGYRWDVEKGTLVAIPPPKVAKASGTP
jgi:hypothetical protein